MADHQIIRRSLLGLIIISLNNIALAEDSYCPAPRTRISAPNVAAVQVSAEQASALSDGHVRLEGKVQVVQGDSKLRAERVDYNAEKQRLSAKNQVLYTNCNIKEPDWFIAADQVSIDNNRAVAKDAWFVFGEVPILYLPRYYITLDETRKSGFLTPGLDSGSETGLELTTPFYFNLASNQDMTLTPKLLSRRGLQLNTDYRYLTDLGRGNIHTDWLSDRKYNSDRYSYRLKHDTKSDDHHIRMLYQRVSDTDYADDFRGPLKFIGDNYLRSYVQIDKAWHGWHLSGVAETIQTSDNNADFELRPFEKRPDISLSKRLFAGPRSGEINLYTNWTLFDYRGPDQFADKVDGQRFDSLLRWQLPYRRPGFFLQPAVQIRYTGYDLDLDTAEKTKNHPEKISRTIPSFSLRSGLVFEKYIADRRYKKTLEPQIYYLNVPYRDQSSVPLYDTGEPVFRFNRLFDDNRFEGVDRISDADQLSFAMTHRILHSDSGKEILRASLGQIFYFRKNRVNLSAAEKLASRNRSDLTGELMLNLNGKIKFYNVISWNNDSKHTQQTLNRLSLNAGNNRLINLFHHYRRDDYKQLGINFSVPVTNRWSLFGGYSYDTKNNKALVTMAGLEYQSCCWKTRLLGQRFLKNINGDGSLATGALDYDKTFGIEFEFRGLGSIDTNVENILENRITGYNY